jgi:Spy/CpxP family protein refolding chaperone
MAVIALLLSCAPVLAQQPYAGLETRAIKTLSEQQIADLNAGRGMGLALAAELNGYPGPMHAIELADRLGLSPDQLARLRALFTAMKAETIPIGATLIAQERGLNDDFARRTVTLASLEAATQQIGATQATLRAAHLKYHLSTAAILTPEQVKQYDALRGYTETPAPRHRHMHK